MKIIPKTQKDFEWVSWKPADIDRVAKETIAKVHADYARIKAIPKKDRTFENTIYALEKAGELPYEQAGVSFLTYVSTDKKVRDASHKASIWMSLQMADIEYDAELYKAFLEYNPKKEKLTDEEKVLYKDTKIWFEKKGFHLDDKKKKELILLLKRESTLGSEFSKRIDDHEDHILCTREELDGLPANYIANLKKDKKTGLYMVSLDYPELRPFLTFAKSDKKRKELAVKNGKKGGKRNLTILAELLQLRHKRAHILGYNSYAHMALSHRMSKKPEMVKTFLESTLSELQPRVKKDMRELEAFGKKTLGISKLTFYNQSYVANAMRKHLFDYDPNLVKEYFPLERVMEYMFELFGGLFGISFKKNNFKLWDKEVMSFDVLENGEPIAHLIFDLFPRSGKFGHMACWNLIEGERAGFRSDDYKAPVSVIVGNFPRGTKKNPSLLSVNEIETLFHEFGHMSHDMLTRASFASHAGTGTDFDFVETPSQLFEKWVENVDVLTDMSRHYKTGASLPKDIQHIISSMSTFMKAGEHYGTFVGGLHDLLMHTTHHNKDVRKTAEMIEKKYGGMVAPNKESLHPAGWGHMVGYASSYYTYMWSLVYAHDVFSRFAETGLKNKKTGKELREYILSRGGSVDETLQLKQFLGRSPNNKAFLKELGIGKKESHSKK